MASSSPIFLRQHAGCEFLEFKSIYLEVLKLEKYYPVYLYNKCIEVQWTGHAGGFQGNESMKQRWDEKECLQNGFSLKSVKNKTILLFKLVFLTNSSFIHTPSFYLQET